MKFSQKYTIIAPLEAIEVGQVFTSHEWPLHVTIADTFAVDMEKSDIIRSITKMVKQGHAFHVKGEKDAYFGRESEVHVVLLANSKLLSGLHNSLIDILDDSQTVFNDPQYTRSGFLPHVTVQKERFLGIGEDAQITQLALIDMFPNEDPYMRKVLAIIKYPA